jgi:hypothetical protein
MGATLVTQVLAHWSHVSDRAFRVLVRMAVTALDKPQNGNPANIYRGGRELLAMSLRNKGGTERTRFRSVAEAVAELTDAGAIEHLVTGWAGQNAVYRLTLGNTITDEMGGPKAHPVDGSTAHPMDVPSARKWMGPEHTPRNQEEITKERGEEEWGSSTPTSHPPRGADSTEPPDNVIRMPKRTSRAQDEIEAAAKRQAAKRKAHQARLVAEQTEEIS